MCDKKLLHVFRFCSDIKFSPKLKSNWIKKKKERSKRGRPFDSYKITAD